MVQVPKQPAAPLYASPLKLEREWN